MNRRLVCAAAITAAVAALTGCAGPSGPSGPGWTILIDGEKGLDNFDRIGEANWRAEGGAIVADRGRGGFLVTRADYRDFALYAEFHAATDTNSGLFVRLSDRKTITADNSYEVNIWDIRPDPKYGTGGIVNFAAVPVPPVFLAGGKWNTYEVEARGSTITVKLNGQPTVTMNNDKFKGGAIALQYGPGVQGAVGGPIKWRNVQVRPL